MDWASLPAARLFCASTSATRTDCLRGDADGRTSEEAPAELVSALRRFRQACAERRYERALACTELIIGGMPAPFLGPFEFLDS